MALTDDKVDEAIEQMIVHCKLMEEQKNYEPISARGVLYTLGYSEDSAFEVIRDIAARGFSYCLDPYIANERDGTTPPSFACHWGPDQLRSRLRALRSR